MSKCAWTRRVEQWFDGESHGQDGVAAHAATCPVCAATLKRLSRLHEGVEAIATREEIGAAQFSAFMAGIREQIEAPESRRTGLWAVLSLTAAALIAALSIFAVVTGGPDPVVAEHTVVESATTEIEGAVIEKQNSSDAGPATIWIHPPRKDVL